MVPLVPWRNSTPFFGAAAFCTTKIGDFRASSTLSSLTTWSTYSSKRRPLRKDQLGGTKRRISRDGRNVHGIMHVHMWRKDDIFRQRRLNHSVVGGGIAFRRVYPDRAYLTEGDLR